MNTGDAYGEDGLTPKQRYEARKAERKKRQHVDHRVAEGEMMDTLDRIATAFERIADGLERRP